MNHASSNTNVKVTIGMCIKNSEGTVKEAIGSVLNQDFPHELMELVVVDGCSHDNTLEIVRNVLKKTDIRTRIFCENEGLGRARQIVVNNADGEYIVWVDGDMVLSNSFVRKQVEFMDCNRDVGIAKGKYGTLTDAEGGNIVGFLEDVGFMLNTLREGEANNKVLGASGCIYRVESIKEVNGFDPHFKGGGEDNDAESRLRSCGWKLHINSAIFYEMRRKNLSSLWSEYFWLGQGASRLLEKDRRALNLYRLFPPIVFARELFLVPAAFKLTRRKSVVLLPFHYIFKRTAWFFGFLKSLLGKSDLRKQC